MQCLLVFRIFFSFFFFYILNIQFCSFSVPFNSAFYAIHSNHIVISITQNTPRARLKVLLPTHDIFCAKFMLFSCGEKQNNSLPSPAAPPFGFLGFHCRHFLPVEFFIFGKQKEKLEKWKTVYITTQRAWSERRMLIKGCKFIVLLNLYIIPSMVHDAMIMGVESGTHNGTQC